MDEKLSSTKTSKYICYVKTFHFCKIPRLAACPKWMEKHLFFSLTCLTQHLIIFTCLKEFVRIIIPKCMNTSNPIRGQLSISFILISTSLHSVQTYIYTAASTFELRNNIKEPEIEKHQQKTRKGQQENNKKYSTQLNISHELPCR